MVAEWIAYGKTRPQVLSLFIVITLSGSRFGRYFAYTRPFFVFFFKLGKQILSLFCVITLLLVISEKAWEADFVARMRDHAPFLDFQKAWEADFVAILRDYAPFVDPRLTCSRSFW